MMLWSALRLGVIFTNIAVAIISLTVFTFHFFGIAGTAGGMNIPQVLQLLMLIITLAVLAQLVTAAALERRKQSALLEAAANHDPITELPNLRLLRQRIKEITQEAHQQEQKIPLGYIAICNLEALV